MKEIKIPKYIKDLTPREAFAQGFNAGRAESVIKIEEKLRKEFMVETPEFIFLDEKGTQNKH